MAAIAGSDYSQASNLKQEELVSCRPKLQGLEVNFQVPWGSLEFAASFLPQLLSAFKVQADNRLKPDYSLRAQTERRVKELHAKGRRAARLLRIYEKRGIDKETALPQIAHELGHNPEGLEHLANRHNKLLKRRYARLRDYQLVQWAEAGLSNRDIAERLGLSESYTAKIVRTAINRVQGGVANDN